MNHPSYNPDLAHNDFHLFERNKGVEGQKFETDDKLKLVFQTCYRVSIKPSMASLTYQDDGGEKKC
jgi:hypothetical protein